MKIKRIILVGITFIFLSLQTSFSQRCPNFVGQSTSIVYQWLVDKYTVFAYDETYVDSMGFKLIEKTDTLIYDTPDKDVLFILDNDVIIKQIYINLNTNSMEYTGNVPVYSWSMPEEENKYLYEFTIKNCFIYVIITLNNKMNY